MSLFSKQLYTPVQESFDAEIPAVEINDMVFESVGESYLADVVTECNEGIMRTISALAITNVMEQAGIVTEGVGDTLKAAKDKVVKFFQDAWAKIRAWFDKVVSDIKVKFASTKKFYDKYNAAIVAKFKEVPEMEVSSFRTYAVALVSTLARQITNLPAKAGQVVADMEKGADDDYKSITQADAIKEIIEGIGFSAETVSQLKELLAEKRYNEEKASGSSKIKVDKARMQVLLQQMKAYSANIKEIQDTRSNAEKLLKAAISAAMGADSKAELQVNSNVYNGAVSVMNGMLPVLVKQVNEVNNYAVAFFKRYLTYSPKKDKSVKTISAESVSTFDSIFDEI